MFGEKVNEEEKKMLLDRTKIFKNGLTLIVDNNDNYFFERSNYSVHVHISLLYVWV